METSQRPNRFLPLVTITGACLLNAPASAQPLNETAELLPADGAADNQFGLAIAIDNGIVAVGAPYDDDNGTNSGSAYLFNATTGAQLAKLLPEDPAIGDEFGWSVAIHNGLVVVGAYLDDDNGSASGSAYLFDADTGTQLAKLTPTDGTADDQFGYAVAIHNGVVAVGAWFDDDNASNAGSAYLFDANTGAQLLKLLPTDPAANDWFGGPIAIHNGLVAVGAIGGDDLGTNSGAAYVFDAANGTQLAKLTPDDGAPGDRFGRAIDIHEGLVAAGAPFTDTNGTEAGTAYLFDANTGTQLATFFPTDPAAKDKFGHAVALDNALVAVGTPYDADNGGASGSAYLFDANTADQLAKLLATDGASGDRLGRALAFDSGLVAAGAWGHDDNGSASGSAYTFNARCPGPQTADLNADGVLDNADIGAFIALFLAADPAADTNNDGVLDNADITTFIQLFLNGC